MSKIVFFVFAGRTANMEAQRPYVTALLDQNPGSELHLWDLTRKPEDQDYVRRWSASDDRVAYLGQFHTGHPIRCRGPRRRGHPPCRCIIHRPPYEMPYKWYASAAGQTLSACDDDTVFVKFDDDVIWMDVERFPEMLLFLETHPNAVASANVSNNAVCAKYEPGLDGLIRDQFHIGGDLITYDEDWWALHTSADFARTSHQWLLAALDLTFHRPEREPVRTRPGEKISINFIAMKYPTLRKVASMMRDGRLGDEGTVDSLLPWIIPNFRVAHLTFGPQDKTMSAAALDGIRNSYREATR